MGRMKETLFNPYPIGPGYQDDLFDLTAGKQSKEDGMNIAADNRMSELDRARSIAVEIAMTVPSIISMRGIHCTGMCCHADLVGRELKKRGLPSNLGPAAGSIFKGSEWQFTGERVLSARKTNHARELKVWRLL